jgi:hypothetical protein
MGEILPLGNQQNMATNPTTVFFEKKKTWSHNILRESKPNLPILNHNSQEYNMVP